MRRHRALLAAAAAMVAVSACGRDVPRPVELTIPPGASFAVALDSLATRGVVEHPRAFRAFARLRGDDRRIRSGRYQLSQEMGWRELLRILTEGRVVTMSMTIPEGFRLTQIAHRIAPVAEVSPDSVLAVLQHPATAGALGVPGPGLEGYLFPDTYRFAAGVPLQGILSAMVSRYQAVWTPERRARLDSLGMSERELVTLASIVQAEARKVEEMPRIASVYHNRLREGWLLQADPTVIYALGGYRARLLFAAIDSVAESPYNTYRKAGLPPGPIGAPGEAAIRAALWPVEEPYFFFVAWPDGTHVFSRTLAEHNRAVAASRRQREEAARESRGSRAGS